MNARTTSLVDKLDSQLAQSRFDSEVLGTGFSASRYCSLVFPIADLISTFVSTDAELKQRFAAANARSSLTVNLKSVSTAIQALYDDLRSVTSEYCRMDGFLYSISFIQDATRTHAPRCRFELREIRTKQEIAVPRWHPQTRLPLWTAVQAGLIDWVSWNSNTLDEGTSRRSIRSLFNGMPLSDFTVSSNRLGLDESHAGLLHEWLWHRFANPFLPEAQN